MAFGILYRALTLITGRRRRKRSVGGGEGISADFVRSANESTLFGSHDLASADYDESGEGGGASGAIETLQDFLWWGKQIFLLFALFHIVSKIIYIS